MYCIRCGKQISGQAKVCTGCGVPVGDTEIVKAEVSNNSPIISSIPNNSNYNTKDHKGLLTLLLGGGSLILNRLPYFLEPSAICTALSLIGIPLAIGGVIVSIRQREKTTMGTVGKVLSIISLVSFLIGLISIILFSIFPFLNRYRDF